MMRSKTLLDKTKIIKSFSRGAATYDQYSNLQKKLARELVGIIKGMNLNPKDILDIGTGTGEAAFLLTELYPGARIIGCDIAPGMIEKARQKGSGVIFDVADCEKLPYKDGSFDLVVSNSTFQWVEDLDSAFKEAKRVLRPGGRFIFVTLGPRTLIELAEAYKNSFTGSSGYLHQYKTIGEISKKLMGLGFEVTNAESKLYKENYRNVKQLFTTIKNVGALSASNELPKGLKGRDKMFKLVSFYERNFNDGGSIFATYEADSFACFLPPKILSLPLP